MVKKYKNSEVQSETELLVSQNFNFCVLVYFVLEARAMPLSKVSSLCSLIRMPKRISIRMPKVPFYLTLLFYWFFVSCGSERKQMHSYVHNEVISV